MSDLRTAIAKITYVNKAFPGEALKVITENKEEAIPYLRDAIEKAVDEKDDLEDNYQLHFYAFFLLGEFQDRDFFPKLIEFVSLPGETLDHLIGDSITCGLPDILYNTCNGDIELLKDTILDEYVDEYVRSGLLDVMGQLYLDGTLPEKEWRAFIKQNVYAGEESSYFYNELATIICRCHFVDMLPEIRYMLDVNLLDEICLDRYDSYVDDMFAYRNYEQNFCASQISTVDKLKSWAMFENVSEAVDNKQSRKEYEKLMNEAAKMSKQQESIRKIGRNDPCPCGSGKKYKFCCLNKEKTSGDLIESAQERNKCLKGYPYTGNEKLGNRVYLEDYFDAESIEIDKLLYLGLMDRPGLIWLKDRKLEEKRCREYLTLAFKMFMEKAQKEGIKTFKEYDQKFSIHYFCEEWTGKLLGLLKENNDEALYNVVKKYRKTMS